MKYRLGLDIGTNSLGWAVVELADDGKTPNTLKAAGARIFPEGREVKSKTTLKSQRTLARSQRRRRDRYKQRRTFLINEMLRDELFPADKAAQEKLQVLDPLQLRASALDTKIALHEIGRVLFHLNQRRGFKSNRKDAESRSGVVRDSIDAMQTTLLESGNRTFGEFLWQRRRVGEPTRARRHGSKAADLYQFYPSRGLLEAEFNTIWQCQQQHYPSILTEERRARYFHIIYFQRPLKPQQKGKCSYFQDQDRCYRALPSFQRYRILQEINNLEWTSEL